jgi:hypothetical protein
MVDIMLWIGFGLMFAGYVEQIFRLHKLREKLLTLNYALEGVIETLEAIETGLPADQAIIELISIVEEITEPKERHD